MKQSILRIILLVMFSLLFKYVLPKTDFLLWAFVTVWALEHWIYAVLWKINFSDNTAQPK